MTDVAEKSGTYWSRAAKKKKRRQERREKLVSNIKLNLKSLQWKTKTNTHYIHWWLFHLFDSCHLVLVIHTQIRVKSFWGSAMRGIASDVCCSAVPAAGASAPPGLLEQNPLTQLSVEAFTTSGSFQIQCCDLWQQMWQREKPTQALLNSCNKKKPPYSETLTL